MKKMIWVIIGAAILLGALYGLYRLKTTPYSSSTSHDSESMPTISVTGIAQNGKMFAQLRTETTTTPLSNFEVWPNEVEGTKVKVRGRYGILSAMPVNPNVPNQGYARDTPVFIVDEWEILR